MNVSSPVNFNKTRNFYAYDFFLTLHNYIALKAYFQIFIFIYFLDIL